MSDSDRRSKRDRLVERIHAAGRPLVIVATGGGSVAIGDLLQVPGGSRTVLEARVPYCKAAIRDFLGAMPEQFCSPATARSLAMRSFWRARTLLAEGNSPGQAAEREPESAVEQAVEQAIGVACTAGLASRLPKKGPHRAHIGVQAEDWTETVSLELTKGARSRREEERLVADLLIDRIAAAAGIEDREPIDLAVGERPEVVRTAAPAAWRDLMLGRVALVAGLPPHASPARGSQPRLIFPGAFNPRHAGHRRMAELAAAARNVPVEFEISIENVDKTPLDYAELSTRLRQFATGEIVWLTRAPTFVTKADLFAGSTFIVGADTILRVADPKYYGGRSARDRAIAHIARQQCRFLVFGREHDRQFRWLENLKLPDALGRLCDGVSERRFREDISSTDLRQARRPPEEA